MSVKKEANGTYTIFYTQKDILSQKTKRTSKRGFKTLKEAKDFERSLSRETSEVLFYSLYKECQKNKDVSEATIYKRDKLVEKYLSTLSKMKYEDITKPFLLNFRIEINELPISNRTKNDIIAIIKSTCSYANAIYDLPNNSKVLKNFKTDKTEFDVWTPEEYKKFEEAISTKYPKYVPFFHTLFWCGLRKGEARALLVDDLDLDNATLTINKSMSKYRKSLKSPKTQSGNRTIKLDAITLKVLTPLKNNEKWLFGSYNPLSLNTITKVFEYGIAQANLKPIRIHDLRHSHATFLICNNANIVAVSKRLGHSSIDITLETYTHLLKDTENQLISILDKANM